MPDRRARAHCSAGLPGPIGPQGPAGAPGARGEPGLNGPQGLQGEALSLRGASTLACCTCPRRLTGLPSPAVLQACLAPSGPRALPASLGLRESLASPALRAFRVRRTWFRCPQQHGGGGAAATPALTGLPRPLLCPCRSAWSHRPRGKFCQRWGGVVVRGWMASWWHFIPLIPPRATAPLQGPAGPAGPTGPGACRDVLHLHVPGLARPAAGSAAGSPAPSPPCPVRPCPPYLQLVPPAPLALLVPLALPALPALPVPLAPLGERLGNARSGRVSAGLPPMPGFDTSTLPCACRAAPPVPLALLAGMAVVRELPASMHRLQPRPAPPRHSRHAGRAGQGSAPPSTPSP